MFHQNSFYLSNHKSPVSIHFYAWKPFICSSEQRYDYDLKKSSLCQGTLNFLNDSALLKAALTMAANFQPGADVSIQDCAESNFKTYLIFLKSRRNDKCFFSAKIHE